MPKKWLTLLWGLAFAAYHMAWTAHEVAAFTLNGFDFAEQVSVHPAVRAEGLQTSILMWLPIPIIAIGFALTAMLYENWYARWGLRSLAFAIALRTIPPEWALRSPQLLIDDTYARALFALTLIGVIGVLISIFGKRFASSALATLSIVGIILPLVGANSAFGIMDSLQLDVSIGGGLIAYVGLLLIVLGIGVKNGFPQWRERTQKETTLSPM